MEEKKIHFRPLLIFYFRKGKSVAQMVNKICSVYGDDALGEKAPFVSGSLGSESEILTWQTHGARVVLQLLMMTKFKHWSQKTLTLRHGISQKRLISHTSVPNHLGAAGYISQSDIWVPHNLTEKNLLDHISISDSLLKRKVNDPFLKRLKTGDEKWVLYNNIVRKKSWGKRSDPTLTNPKAGLHPKKGYGVHLVRLEMCPLF